MSRRRSTYILENIMLEKYSVGHVAIIPDGNRRWAKAKGEMPWAGHEAGVKAFEHILRKAHELNIYCTSFWGMSRDNMTKRENREVQVLLKIFENVIKKAIESKELAENGVRLSIIGEWREQFPRSLVEIFDRAIETTRSRTRHVLNLMLCYDGKSEMQKAFENARSSQKDFSSPKEFLMTKDLPPVDLVIRTGGEPHLSAGFMMWDTADAQLSFTDKLWPDFTPEDFEAAVEDFKRRERRFGA